VKARGSHRRIGAERKGAFVKFERRARIDRAMIA
jgi:hypothetical protein